MKRKTAQREDRLGGHVSRRQACLGHAAPDTGPPGISERAKGVRAEHVQVLSHARREASDVFVVDGVAGDPEPVEGSVDVDGVPPHDAIEGQVERPELVFQAVVVS